MRKLIIWIVVVVVLFLVGFRVYKKSRQRIGATPRVASITSVRVIEPRIGDISSILEFAGNIKGEDQVQVFAEAPGKLIKYTVTEGESVAKDQVIAMLDRSVTGMEFEPLKVKSPISGVVGNLFLDQGSTVSPQVPVAMIVKMDKVKAVFNVGEKDLGKVKIGLPVKILVDAYPEKIFKGKIAKISPVMDPRTRSTSCEAIIWNPRHKLKPGMFAEIEVLVEAHRSVILLPENVVVQDLEQGKNYVFCIKDSIAEKREVELGISSNDTVEIISGLEGEETIVSKGQHFLKDGEKVKIVR